MFAMLSFLGHLSCHYTRGFRTLLSSHSSNSPAVLGKSRIQYLEQTNGRYYLTLMAARFLQEWTHLERALSRGAGPRPPGQSYQ